MDCRTVPGLAAACLAAGALLAGCSPSEETAQENAARDPSPALTHNPVMTRAPDGGALTPGEWVIGEDANGAHARFGPPNSEPVFAIECDAPSQVLSLSRAGAATVETTYILEAGGLKASVDMTSVDSEPPMLHAEINQAMPIFQAFAQLGNAISVTGPDGEVLRMQGARGIGRVIEACSRS